MGALSDWFVRRMPAASAPVRSASQPLLAQGSRVLVCGASGALGAAIASAFVAEGASVFLHAHRNLDRVQTLADRLGRSGGSDDAAPKVHCASADLRDAAQARSLVEQAHAAMGGLDVLVTSIGSAKDAPLPLVDASDILTSMQENLLPVILICEAFCAVREQARREAGDAATTRGGRIINVSSVTGMVGQPMRVAYGAAKGAVVSYTKSLARELAMDGITVNAIAPQVIEGGLADLMKMRVRTVLLANTPVGRTCLPEDVAHGVTYLASPAASFVTGTVLTISGGLVTW